MNTPTVCTIASNNYLPFARVFAKSFLARHPEGRVWTLVVDEPDPTLDYAAEPFGVVFVKDLGIRSFRNVAFRYSILELNTAVKPYFLRYLVEREGCSSLCYFDPDILVTGDLGPLFATLEASDLILTPHILEGIDDDHYPGEREFLLSGIFNLGFLGFSANERTMRFLGWWEERLHQECVHRIEKGLFVDQKWMDFACAFVDGVEVLRDPGYNVAYWNLVHREIGREGDELVVGDRPLRFFHFSGVRLDNLEAISRYQDRFTLEDRPDVRPLFERYRDALVAEGALEQRDLPYAYGSFDDGRPIPQLARRILQRLDPDGEIWSDPFSAGSRDSFLAWLTEQVKAPSGALLPRLALALWDERMDVQAAFPCPLGQDDPDFSKWFVEEAARSHDLDPVFAEATERSLVDVPEDDEQTSSPVGKAGRGNVFAKLLTRGHGASWRIDRDIARWWASRSDFGLLPGSRVSRLAMLLHGQRADLQAAFPKPLGASRQAFALWFSTYGRLEYGLPARVVAPVLRSLPLNNQAYARLWWLKYGIGKPSRRRGGRRKPLMAASGKASAEGAALAPFAPGARRADGGNRPSSATVVGWVESPTGVGEVCRGNLAALEAAGAAYSVLSLNHPALDRDEPLLKKKQRTADPRSPILLCHVNADMMGVVRNQLPRAVQTDKCIVGYWFWELAHFPLSLAASFDLVDEVWAPSRFCQQAYSTLAPCDVRWVPPGVRPPGTGTCDRGDLGLPEDAFLFFFAFDALSVPERKNPAGLLKAFELVVEELGWNRVHLLLKVSHAADNSPLLKRLGQLVGDLPVTLLARSIDRRLLQGLFAESDAYVSLHRSEGLGLPLIEAMHLNKPVIATDYGGCTDFLDDEIAWPVRYRLEQLDRAHGPYPAGAVWAEPDVEHAARQMVEVVRRPELREAKGKAARARVEELYGLLPAGRRIRAEIERITGERLDPEEFGMRRRQHP